MLKLIERGKMRDDLWRLLMLNTPPARGARRRPARHDRLDRASAPSGWRCWSRSWAPSSADDFFEGVLAHADRRFRRLHRRGWPQGAWRAEEPVDNDCFEPIDGKIAVALTVKDDGLIVDFAGTSPQISGFKNSSIANSTSAVFMALSSFFEPDLPSNEGAFRRVEIRLPEGTHGESRGRRRR